MYILNSTFKFLYLFILIYRVNIGKRATLNKNIGIVGHLLKDRDFIGNKGMLEGLKITNIGFSAHFFTKGGNWLS